jgi:hypothetical protein
MFPFAHAFAFPTGDGVIVNAQSRIGYDPIGIDSDDVAESFTTAARPDGAIERKQLRTRFREDDSVSLKFVRKFPGIPVVGEVNKAPSTSFKESGFHRVKNP